jgi:hypothetical protein
MKNVIKGFANLAVGNQEELSKERIDICKTCDISKGAGQIFNNWCNGDNGGCGCYLPAKTRVPNEKCPKGKW